jgi:hypothetical protein
MNITPSDTKNRTVLTSQDEQVVEEEEPTSPGLRAISPGLVLPACLAILAIPFIVAIAGQRSESWFPVLDLAMTELRVKDVFTGDTPLIGLPGRIGGFPDQGSHPGSLSFYALAPLYRLFGSTAWALQAATGAVNFVACALALWIARRCGGPTLVAVVALLLIVLIRGYGIQVFLEPWNPLLPLLWFVVLLLAVYAVLGRDVKMLPIVVVAASFCVQTHVSYVGLALGVGVLALIGAVLAFRGAPTGSDLRRDVVRCTVIATAVGVVLWLPPVIDQTSGTHNVSMLVRHFTTEAPQERIGLGEGSDWLLVNMNPRYFAAVGDGVAFGPLVAGGPLVKASQDASRSVVPGALLLAAWSVAAGVAVVWRHAALLRLHALIGMGLLAGLISLSNVFGNEWYYLSLWAWVLAAGVVASILWSVLVAVRRGMRERSWSRLGLGAATLTVVLTSVLAATVTVTAADDDPPDAMLSRVLGEIVSPTAEALDAGTGAADGPSGRYLVMWSDAYVIGAQGYGLVLELERRGFDVGVTEIFRVPATSQRVLEPEEVTAEIHVATGMWVDEVATWPGAVEIVRTDPRSLGEVDQFVQLRREIIMELRQLGRHDLVPLVDENLFALPNEPGVPPALEDKVFEMLALGQPTAVFILPPGS